MGVVQSNDDPVWVVFDVETTGLTGSSRVVEFACEVVGSDGSTLSRYQTLVDVGCLPGPTELHGLTAEDLEAAPTFTDVARDIARLFRGAVPVSHNLRFDWTILRGEFARLRVDLPILPRGVCTVALARTTVTGRPRLDDLCAQLGVARHRRHEAAADAAATREVFTALRARGASLPPVVACGSFPGSWRPAGLAPTDRAIQGAEMSRRLPGMSHRCVKVSLRERHRQGGFHRRGGSGR